MDKNDIATSANETIPPASPCRARRRLLQSLVLSLTALGALSMVAQVTDLWAATSGFLRDQDSFHQNEQKRIQSLVVQRTKAPYKYDSEKIKRKCYAERDMGIIPAVPQGALTFCADGGWDSVKQVSMSLENATRVTTYKVAGGIWSTTFQNLMLDLVGVQIHKPIESMANDGGSHDPRFRFNPRLINCACDELVSYFTSMADEKMRWSKQIWEAFLRFKNVEVVPNATICMPPTTKDDARSSWDFINHPFDPPDPNKTLVFDDPVVLIARRDDHNPFFQVSYALNSWIMLKGLGWDISKTHVIHLDGGYPSPIDTLHQKLLAPNHELIDGNSLMGKRIHFRGDVMLAPFEIYGPMMQHLNNEEPCYDSKLFKSFRAQSLLTQNITPEVERALGVARIRPMIVTVITRRPYKGRSLQRIWINEDEILGSMRTEYKDLDVMIRSIEYANLTLAEQMKTTIESDIIISMHGAGLVNVLWTRQMTTVVEIFPKKRFRWGYRNLCQLIGCDWHEFRGGEDIGGDNDPNSKNKRILFGEWMNFFNPLFRETYDAFEKQQAILRGVDLSP
ncbi:hypothetical protein L915_18148 [Plasmopara halstedii]|uniref:Glycosyltransferase 61 catalytic domain-containing protein n=1 Tax=Plasmopara halstedii TaxID=4781 RepID=A0A0P1AK29_PLAHL|nr:hypothetical protein L915_18148 [Plasmopara halstedii]CEG41599.1 hypothetical protein L915_18148 [Plasmopara halstedii]|eukprot:XP_024577968.1 hypothetical protein L915_18148 [Plasmopara halstedii]